MHTALPTSSSIPIAEDLLCTQCQYNLRTRMASDRCPECGSPISQTIAHYRAHAGAIADPRMFRAAAYVLTMASVLPVFAFSAVYALKFLIPGSPLPGIALIEALIQVAGHIVFAVAVLISVFLIGGSLSAKIISAGSRSAIALLAVAYTALSGMSILSFLAAMRRSRRMAGRFFFPLFIAQEQRFGSAMFYLIMSIVGLAVMRNLAKSLASSKLLRLTHLVFGSLIADFAFSLIIYSALLTWQRGRPRFLNQYDILFFAIDFATVAIACGFGWYWSVVARTIGAASKASSKSAPIMEASSPSPAALAPPAKVANFLAHRRSPESSP